MDLTAAADIHLVAPDDPLAPHEAPVGPAEPLVRLLEELAGVLAGLGDGQYVLKPVGVIPGSVGGHVRHCLDHVAALLAAVETGRLDYDQRRRGTDVETCRRAALNAIGTLAVRLSALPPGVADRPLRVSLLLSSDRPPVEVASSVGREIAYVLSHTIHHNAIVGAMVKTLGGAAPARFGYAPATIRHRRSFGPVTPSPEPACVR